MKLRYSFILIIFMMLGCSSGNDTDGVKKKRNYTDQLRYDRETGIVVKNFNGDIDLKADPQLAFINIEAVISVTGRNEEEAQLFLDNMEIDFQSQSDTVKAEAVVPKVWVMPGDARKPVDFKIDMLIEVPSSLNVECENTSGKITVTGTHGDISVVQQKGDMNILGTLGKVQASTIEGNITVRNDQDYDLDIQQVTQKGNLELTLPYAVKGKFNLRTIKGDIKIEMPEIYEPEMVINSTAGNINMSLGRRLASFVELESESGVVETNMVVNTTTTEGAIESAYINGMIGAGTGNIKAETKKGDIIMNYYGENESEST